MALPRDDIQVLLIEDSAGDALLTSQILAEFPGRIKLIIARDGAQALTMLEDTSLQPALIILDLNIPLIPGHVFLERNPRKDIPVVVFSVSADEKDRLRALERGARDYVAKPMDLQDYRAAVLQMVERWATGSGGAASGAGAA